MTTDAQQKKDAPAMEYLSAAEILNTDDRFYTDLSVPEWKTKDGKPGMVRLQSLTAEEVSEYVESIEGPAKRNALVLVVMRAVVDGNGRPVFNDPGQLGMLKRRSMKAFMRIQEVVLQMNGLDKKAQEVAKNA